MVRLKHNIIIILIVICITSCNKKDNSINLGVVSSATPEASKAGEQILLKGGNAIDAAIAVSFALAVTESAMSGLGGGTQVLLSLKNQPPIAINGTTLSPKNTPLNVSDTLTYHRRSTIPSTVKVLDYLWRNYGSGKISWKELIEPSIELATNGYKVGKYRAKVYKEYRDKLLKSKFNTNYFLNNDGNIPEEDEIIKQPILANTLKRLAKYGADDFYKGQIAKDIADDMKINGGWITFEDLVHFPEPKKLNPLSTIFNGMTVYSQPPPCGGWTTLLALNLMEESSKDQSLTDSEVVKALYLAQMDRKNKPITDLVNFDSIVKVKLSKDYSKQMQIEKEGVLEDSSQKNSGETTHFSIVDSQGNAIAVTSSINAYFGSLSASKNLGFLYNTYMDDYIFENEEHPFAIRPNAMAYSSMSPTIVQNKGKNVLVIGSPGSSRIISTVSQIAAKWINNGDIQKLIGDPRIHVSTNSVYFENEKDTILLNQNLKKILGLSIKTPSKNLMLKESLNAYFGGVHAIAKEGENWVGVADPRRDGNVIKVEIIKK